MDITRDRLGRALLAIGACASITATVGNSGCVVDGIPACPGRCFEFTLVEPEPRRCIDNDGEGGQLGISFTDGAQTGYRGRYCFNAASLPNVIAATEHMDAGGQLSDLSDPVRVDYVAVVDAVVADIEAECIAAAPGQCDNAAEVCSGIAGDAYQQLVVDQTCALEDGGVESITLLQHVSAKFGVFADEHVTLTIVDRDAPCGPGARLDGLDDGEHASALAEAFDIRNKDVVAEIGTSTIVGVDDAMDAVAAVLEDPSTALIVRRPEGPGCKTLVYAIDVL